MATETGPDLTAARTAVEELMDDTCTVVAPDTLTDAALIAAPVIYVGPCLISDPSQRQPGVGDRYEFDAGASLPATSVGIAPGQVLIVDTSRRDPELPGTRYVVRRVKRATMLVSRKLELERYGEVGEAPGGYPEEVTP